MNYRVVNGNNRVEKSQIGGFWILLFAFGMVGKSYAQTYNNFHSQSNQVLWIGYWKFRAGDSTNWANPKYAYQHWKLLRLKKRTIINKHQGVFWLKTKVHFTKNAQNNPIVLHHYMFNAASEVYWDGVNINKNGKVGHNLGTEQSGSYTMMSTIPDSLLKAGIHQLSVRVSNFHYPGRSLFGRPNIGTALSMQQKENQWILEHTLMTTVLGLTILFCALLFFGLAKNFSLLFFIGFCLIQMLELLLGFYGVYQNIDIGIYNTLLDVLNVVKTIDGFCLVGYIVFEFQIGQKRHWLTGAFVVSVITSIGAFYHLSLIWLMTTGVLLVAIWHKKYLAMAVLGGVIGWVLFTYGYVAWGYFYGLIILMLSMIITSILQMYRGVKAQHQMELRTSRLENQLLKKNIQPHFLMNSLISLQQLIHEDPFKAEEMIDELAIEFHVFSRVAEKKLISMKDELKLCQAHLRIMEFRKGATFLLETINITGEEEVPPAIFHTLIENGITHGYGNKQKGYFVLEKSTFRNQIRYRLFNDGETDSDAYQTEEQTIGSGTGMKYVQARLSESYGARWEMNFGKVTGGWETIIEIPKP